MKYSLPDLLKIMEDLRSENGCPWDKVQTHESILKCLLEESAEYYDAVLNKDTENMKEELGDILLQVVFHSQLANEEGKFNIDDVIQGISEKLVRRHPHVFGDLKLETEADVMTNWEKIKKQEKEGENKNSKLSPVFEGIPKELLGLLKAEKIQNKAKKYGFDWEDYKGPLLKIEEEFVELKEAIVKEGPNVGDPNDLKESQIEEELGDLLFSVVNTARHLNVDPALALEKANKKFMKRFNKVMDIASSCEIQKIEPKELNRIWEEVKKLNL